MGLGRTILIEFCGSNIKVDTLLAIESEREYQAKGCFKRMGCPVLSCGSSN